MKPTLIVWGDADEAAPAADAPEFEAIFRSHGPCELVLIPKAKHLVIIEQPDVVARDISMFVGAHCRQRHGPQS